MPPEDGGGGVADRFSSLRGPSGDSPAGGALKETAPTFTRKMFSSPAVFLYGQLFRKQGLPQMCAVFPAFFACQSKGAKGAMRKDMEWSLLKLNCWLLRLSAGFA
eukprot:1765511-Pyramimonas_sp.AAC.2